MRTRTRTDDTNRTEATIGGAEAVDTDRPDYVRTMDELRAGAGCRRCPSVLDETAIFLDGETKHIECPKCGIVDEVVGR